MEETLVSVYCEKCGEPLMGAVNRCWKCGTTFAKVESAPIPPVRRAPVLPAYLAPPQDTIESSTPPAEPTTSSETPEPPDTLQPLAVWQAWARQLDHVGLAGIALALVAVWLCWRSPWGIPVGLAAVMLTIANIRQWQSIVRWTGFLLGIGTFLLLLVRLMVLLFSWTTGGDLFLVLFGP